MTTEASDNDLNRAIEAARKIGSSEAKVDDANTAIIEGQIISSELGQQGMPGEAAAVNKAALRIAKKILGPEE